MGLFRRKLSKKDDDGAYTNYKLQHRLHEATQGCWDWDTGWVRSDTQGDVKMYDVQMYHTIYDTRAGQHLARTLTNEIQVPGIMLYLRISAIAAF